MKQASRFVVVSALAIMAGMTLVSGSTAAGHAIQGLNARVVALNVPGASAIAQIGDFLNVPPPDACANPIPSKFPDSIKPGGVLDPVRLLVGSRSNFGAPRATGVGQEGSFLSIDPNGTSILIVPTNFAKSGDQASTLGGAVQMFSANSPHWFNGVNNPGANTALLTGVSNPLGLSNNNAFGRIWPANAPFGDAGVGSSTILDPTGLPLAGAPNQVIGGVYAGDSTNRNVVATPQQPQVIPGSLNTGAVGTAFLGPSPDGTCKAVFAVVTADGAIVQEHTQKGLDGLAPADTVEPLQGQRWHLPNNNLEPRLGVLMNPYAPPDTVLQLFVSEPFNNTIAVIDLVVFGTAPNQVFGLGSVNHIRSFALNLPVDLAPVKRDTDDVKWASNTTLDRDSDFYVANRGDNTIVRMKQNGHVVAIRRVTVDGIALKFVNLNGIATSPDGNKIYVTFTGPEFVPLLSGVLEVPTF
jgi:hypothetical protein